MSTHSMLNNSENSVEMLNSLDGMTVQSSLPKKTKHLSLGKKLPCFADRQKALARSPQVRPGRLTPETITPSLQRTIVSETESPNVHELNGSFSENRNRLDDVGDGRIKDNHSQKDEEEYESFLNLCDAFPFVIKNTIDCDIEEYTREKVAESPNVHELNGSFSENRNSLGDDAGDGRIKDKESQKDEEEEYESFPNLCDKYPFVIKNTIDSDIEEYTGRKVVCEEEKSDFDLGEIPECPIKGTLPLARNNYFRNTEGTGQYHKVGSSVYRSPPWCRCNPVIRPNYFLMLDNLASLKYQAEIRAEYIRKKSSNRL